MWKGERVIYFRFLLGTSDVKVEGMVPDWLVVNIIICVTGTH